MTTRSDQEDTARPAGLLRECKSLAQTVGLALVVALLLRTLLFQPFTIPSDSMEPTLRDGDYVVISKYDYGFSRHSIPLSPPLFSGRLFEHTPRRGDVIVFKLPRDDGLTDYVKRLIGLPGDRIEMRHGVLVLNGRPVQETQLGPAADPDDPRRPVIRLRETLPDGRSYVILQALQEAEGETTGVYTVPTGQYFFMGDNRDNSADSRWPTETGVGFVPAENLEGKAQAILLSWRGASLWKPWTWFVDARPSRFFNLLK